MSIYEEENKKEKIIKMGKKAALPIAVIIVLVLILWTASEALKPFPFTTSLNKNPIYNVNDTYTILTVKVTNLETGRIDVHKNISREEADWIAVNPNLRVEVLEVAMRRRRRKNMREQD